MYLSNKIVVHLKVQYFSLKSSEVYMSINWHKVEIFKYKYHKIAHKTVLAPID